MRIRMGAALRLLQRFGLQGEAKALQSRMVTAHPHPTSPTLGEESIQFPPWNGEG